MTDEEARRRIGEAMNTLADAMSAFYDDDYAWFRKCIDQLTDDKFSAYMVIQAAVQCLVRLGVRPSTFRIPENRIIKTEEPQ